MTTIDQFVAAQAQFNTAFNPPAQTGVSIWRWEGSDTRVPMFIRSGEWSAEAPHLRKWWKQIQIYGEGTGQIRVYNDGAFIASLTLVATEQPTKPRRINLPVGTKGYGLSFELQGDFSLRALSIGYEPLPNIQENV